MSKKDNLKKINVAKKNIDETNAQQEVKKPTDFLPLVTIESLNENIFNLNLLDMTIQNNLSKQIFKLNESIEFLEKINAIIIKYPTGRFDIKPPPDLKSLISPAKKQSNESKRDNTTEQKNEIAELRKLIQNQERSIQKLENENSYIKETLYSNATTFQVDNITQTLPISIYLDTNEPHEIFEVYDAIIKFSKSIGFKDHIEFDAVKGSWYKKILARTKEKLTHEELLDRLKEAEYGIEVNGILKQQSEIDKNQSEALSNILSSLKDIPNAAIRIGALIVVKLTDETGRVSLQTRTLSIKELHLLNKQPELLQMPEQIMQALANVIEDTHSSKISEN